MVSARILIEVTAGMIPGRVDAEFTKKWAVSSEEWDGGKGLQAVLDTVGLAHSYALKLQLNSMSGMAPNWVRVDWVWL